MSTISEKMQDILELTAQMRKDMIAMGWEVPLPVEDLDEGFTPVIFRV